MVNCGVFLVRVPSPLLLGRDLDDLLHHSKFLLPFFCVFFGFVGVGVFRAVLGAGAGQTAARWPSWLQQKYGPGVRLGVPVRAGAGMAGGLKPSRHLSWLFFGWPSVLACLLYSSKSSSMFVASWYQSWIHSGVPQGRHMWYNSLFSPSQK